MISRSTLTLLILVLVTAWPKSGTAQPDKDSTAKELAKLQGSWELVYQLWDGKVRSQSMDQKKVVITFTGNKYVVKTGNVISQEGTMGSFNPTKSPKVFDHTILKASEVPDAEGKTFPAIYLLEDDLFIACVGKGTIPVRPTQITAEAGSNNLLIIYKRIKK